MTLFDLPDGTTVTVTISKLVCAAGHESDGPVELQLVTTNSFSDNLPENIKGGVEGVRRYCLFFHNPVCDCNPGIWISNCEAEIED